MAATNVQDSNFSEMSQIIDATSPSWETLGFNEDIPATIPDDRAAKVSESLIYGMVIDSRMVYRVFSSEEGIKELFRYVFIKDKLFIERCNLTREIVEPGTLTEVNAREIVGPLADKELLEAFKENVDISNKPAMLRIMPYIRYSYSKMCFSAFLEVYLKTRANRAETEGIPERILRELYGRNHNPYNAVKIDKDLVVITGEKCNKYISLREQTRVYFDSEKTYYFVKNAATGFWQKEDLSRKFEYEWDIKDRLVDRDLFNNTCVEKYAIFSIDKTHHRGNRVLYGSLLAQMVFLSAEQAAKTNSSLYGLILKNIYRGRIKDGSISLPELIGITGPQLKYLYDIEIPDNLDEYRKCIKDDEFIRIFPDIKKRIFAASFFLTNLYRNKYEDRELAKRELFMAAQTICSIEKYDGERRRRLADEYADYLRMRREYFEKYESIMPNTPLWSEIKAYGEPKVNIKPSKIHDQHYKLGKIMNIIKQKKTIEDYDSFIIEIKKNEADDIEYTDGKFSILLPENANEIIREGRILHHCVGHGGYIEAMAKHTCRILFLRDNTKLDKPLITIEERDGKISQCYGFANRINTDPEIRDFIEKFAAERGWGISAAIYSDDSAPARRMHQDFLTQEEINRLLAGLL